MYAFCLADRTRQKEIYCNLLSRRVIPVIGDTHHFHNKLPYWNGGTRDDVILPLSIVAFPFYG